MRRFEVSSSVCFGVSRAADTISGPARSGSNLAAEQPLRVRVQCVPCEPAKPLVRPACPALKPPTARKPRAGHVFGQSESCPDYFTVEVGQD